MSAETVRARDVMRHRAARLLLLADLVDGSGTWAFNTVFALVVFERTHSVSWITISLACRWVPAMIGGPFAGVVADRYDRPRVMIASAAGSAAIMGAIAAGVACHLPLGLLLVLSGLQAVVASAYNPAFGAALPDVVPERLLAAANGVREVIYNAGIVAGPAFASLLLLTGDPAWGIVLNAVSYLVPIAVQLRLRIRSKGAGGRSDASPVREVLDGVIALRAQRTAVVLIIAVTVDSAVAGMNTGLSLPISRYVGTGSTHYGYLLIALSLGSVTAAGLSSRLAGRPRLAFVITGALVLETLPFAVIALVPHAAAAFVCVFLSGVGMIVVDIVGITGLQRDVPSEYLGRILGLLDSTLYAFVAAFTVLGGAMVGWFGLRTTLLVVGFGVSVLMLAGLPLLRETDRRSAARAAVLEPIVELLQRLDLFAGADRPALERLAIAAHHVEVPTGSVVLREGDAATDVWLLAAGIVGIESAATGPLPDVVAPGYVGEIGVLHERPRTATVTAHTDCSFYRLTADDFRDALTGRAASASLLLLSGQRLARTERRRPTAAPRPPES